MSWLLLFTLACAKDPAPAEAPVVENPTEAPAGDKTTEKNGDNGRVRDGAPEAGGAPVNSGGKSPPKFGGNIDVTADPAAAYELYRERLEGPEAAGECAADADCAKAGCSSEVCVPAAQAGDINTTCDVLPVFAVLDACGCVDTKCSWTVKQ